MAGLPLLKLGGLAVKTLAKPVAKRLKNEAATRPGLKQLYVNVGQWTHRATAWITISAAGHKSLGVKDLEEAAAFARGADFLSEAFVFFVGGGILTFEYTRSNMSAARKEAEKERQRQQFREDLETRFLALEARLEALEEKNAAGWARLLGRKEGNKDLLEAPHFADPSQVKQKRRRLSQSGGVTPAMATAGTGGAVNGSVGGAPVVGEAAATAAADAAAAAVPLAPMEEAQQESKAEELLSQQPLGLWGRVLGWVGVRRPQAAAPPSPSQQPAPQVESVAVVGDEAPALGNGGGGGGGCGKVKATSALVLRRCPPGRRRERSEADRYWWRILFV